MSEKLIRNFRVTDSELLGRGDVIGGHFNERLPDFMTFNATKFTSEYPSHLNTVMDAARETMSDTIIVQEQAKESADVEDVMQEIYSLFIKVEYFVEETYGRDQLMLKQYGLHRYNAIRRNPDKLNNFIHDFCTKVRSNLDAISQHGLQEQVLNSLELTNETLREQRREQLNFMDKRPLITRDRVEKLNALHDELVAINKAATIIYSDSPEELALFDLPQRKRISESGSEDEEIVAE